MASASRTASHPTTVASSSKGVAKTASERRFSVPRTLSEPAMVQLTHKRAHSPTGDEPVVVLITGAGPPIRCTKNPANDPTR